MNQQLALAATFTHLLYVSLNRSRVKDKNVQ